LDTAKNSVKKRDGDRTRARLLDAAFSAMHKTGYQAMRVDAVIKNAGATKGAFYHHFVSKHQLGEAVIDEVLSGAMEQMWVRTLQDYPDPVEGIKAVLRIIPATIGQQFAQLGCPLNNLAQELSPIDEVFREKLNRIFHVWIGSVSEALKRGQQNGSILPGIDTHGAAIFIIAAYEGAVSMSKSEQSDTMLATCASQIELYLEGLRL
jgi:AcrR family transcriptional regulator